jgi:dihydroflavonol-4-reductase
VGKTLVTGGSGFVGSHVVRALAERGDDLRLLVRRGSGVDHLADLEFERASGDVMDRRAVARAVKGAERVFHIAGTTSMLAQHRQKVFDLNVKGTRIVLEESLREGVERVVFTSSVAAIGPASPSGTVDETHPFTAGGLGIAYVNSKHEAEVEALRLAARGLPVVIVNPGHVFGRGDLYRSSTDIVRRFLRRQIPAYVDGALNIVDVRDVARGHLAADERGEPGERYILGNRNYTLDRLFADLGRISGVEPPALKLPRAVALAFAEAQVRLPGRPQITPVEVRASGLWWAFRNTKAKRELGWRPSPHEDTIEATVAWYREREGDRVARPGARQPLQLRAAGALLKQFGGLAGRVA